MTITFIGDSLTAGNLGIPYLKSVKLPPGTRVVNRGRDGDTAAGVRDRLQAALRTDGASILVIQVGANDILLPEMARRGGGWTPFINQMISQGSIASPNPEDFESIYTELITTAGAWGITEVIGVTIPPLGENLSSARNRGREQLNRRIRRALAASGAALADAAEAFENALEESANPSDYFFSTPAEFITDLRRIRREKGTRTLCKQRGLHLTMDGAHLNETGAALMAQVISAVIQ